jgi:hypothetical protein
VLPHQESAAPAGEALDQVRPDAARDLDSAFRRDPELIGQAAEATGGAARDGRGARCGSTPTRADRFVESWRGCRASGQAATRRGRQGHHAHGRDGRGPAPRPELANALERRAPELELKPGARPEHREIAGAVDRDRPRSRQRLSLRESVMAVDEQGDAAPRRSRVEKACRAAAREIAAAARA